MSTSPKASPSQRPAEYWYGMLLLTCIIVYGIQTVILADSLGFNWILLNLVYTLYTYLFLRYFIRQLKRKDERKPAALKNFLLFLAGLIPLVISTLGYLQMTQHGG